MSAGASIIRMIKHAIGENVFQKGLHNYLSEMYVIEAKMRFGNRTNEINHDTFN